MIASFVPVQAFATSPDTSEQQTTVTAIQLESELSDTSILTAEQQSDASLVPTTLAALKVSNPETFLTSANVENASTNGIFSLFSAPSPQGGLPTEANGSKIESLSITWKTEDDYSDNSATRLSLAPTDIADRTAVISLEAALSGQRDYAPGDISFTVPSKMFKDRDGNDTGRFRILSNPSFSYTVNADDTYSIVNTVSLPAATSLMMQFAFDGLSPELMCGDGATASDVFWADLIVNTEASETGETQDIGMTASGLDATFKTDSKVKDATATVQKLYSNGAYPSTFPASLAPANPENYIYIDWYTYAYMEGNQYFDMDLTSRLSGASGAILLGMKDDKGNVYKNTSLSASFTASLDKKAYRTERGYYVHTYAAYPANLTSDVTYTYKLDSTYTMTCIDTKAKTTSTASAEKSYTPKTWETPVGHFGISKYGYETYPMALNDLIAGQNQTARFTLKTLGFGAPFTCKKYYDSNETIPQKELYEMTYKLITDDYATWWNNDTVQLKSADFEFEKLDIERPLTYEYVQFDSTGPGYFNNAEGHIEKGTVEAGDFGYRVTDDYPTWQPSIVIYGFKNNDTQGALPDGTPDNPEGNAIKFGEIRWTGLDTYTAKAFNGARFDGTTLYFPSGVTDIRQVAETLAGGCEYYVYPYVKLKANATNIKLAQDLFDNSDVPETYVRNEAKVHALVQQGKYVGQELTHYWEQTNDVIYGGDDTLIGASDGVALDVSAQASEPTSANGNYSFTYRVTMKHSTNLTSIAKYNEAVEKGYMADEESGVFYMLLPPGLSLQGSPYMYSGDTIENWRIEKNWRDSGRDMLIVEAYSPRDPGYRLASSSVIGKAGYGQEILVGFRGTMTRDDIIEFGTDGRLIAAYQSENTSMGNISGVKGEPDNPLFGNHNESRGAVAGYEDEFTALSSKMGKETPAFVYGRDRTMFALLFAGTAGLTKDVSIDNGATFSRGTGSDELNVYANDTYTYRLRETAGSEDESHVVLYDKFESYAPEGVDSADTTWQGTFVSVDTSKLEAAGIEPVVYYSTDASLDLNNAAHRNLADTSRWSKQQPTDKASIKAIAIDGTKTRKGGDYVLKSGHSMTAYITMRAPLVADLVADAKAQGIDSTASDWYDKTVDNTSAAENGLAGGAHALNGVARTSTIKGASNQFVYTGYTKVGLKPFVLEITKKWNDENDLDGYRPDSVDVDVMASVNGSAPEKVRSVTLRSDIAGNTWIPVKVDDLPYMDENGNKIEYTLVENMDDATAELYTYSVKMASAPNADGMVKAEITNTHVPDTLSATVKKVWNDEDNYENIRPESVEISVCRKDPDTGTLYYVTGQTKTASAESDWTVTFEGLPQQYNGKYIEYVLYEKQVSGYTASYSINGAGNSFTVTKGAKKFEGVVTNTHTPESMDFTFTKEWEDTNNADRVRPTSINVDIIAHYADGTEEVADTVTLTSDGADGNTWTPKTSKKLHLTDTDGSKITYTFAERMGDAEGKYRPVERYQNWNYVTGHTETIITNYHDLDTVSATVQKIWDDENDYDGYRPESVKIYVGRADAPNTYIQMKEATAENNWTVTFDGLPQMRDGKYITYHVFEGRVANYDEPIYSINGGDNQITISPDVKEFSATITNHHEVEMKHFKITKEWNDNDNLDGYRPGYVDVDIMANYIDGKKKVVQTVRLQDKDAEGNIWKPVSTMELPNRDENGQVITYTFEEKLTGDAAGKYSQTTRFSRVAATGEIGVTLTNTHTLDNLSATVTKIWDDGNDCDKVRPESVDISICRVTNGVKYYVQTKAATAENNWTVTFDGLPQQRNGKFIEYVIYEPKQNGYEYPVYSINGGDNSIVVEQGMKSFTGTVTNKRTPEQLKFTFTKIWDDGDDHDKMRPNEIQVNVFADGKRLEDEQLIMRPTYAGSNAWTTVSTGFLPKHASDGHEIAYTFTESLVGNADTEIPDYISSFTETSAAYMGNHGPSSASPQQSIRYTIKNTHPILLATFTGMKQWNDNRNAAGARPSQVIIDVYANGTKVQEIPVTGGAQDVAWEFEIELEALDTNGHEIEYTFEEQPVAGYWFEKVDEEKFIFENNYYPYGELTIEKSIENATNISKDTEFSFRVELETQEGTPVSGTYKWTRSDGVEGEVENGGTVPLRGGQTVTVHQIPSECTYTVTELASAGWTLNSNQTQSGAVAPKSENKTTFSNTYSASGSAMITAHKSVSGTDLRARQFSFQLLSVSGTGDETVIGTSYNAADGSIAFNPIRYATEDAGKTFAYKIRENDTGAAGYTYDSKVYDCYVDVIDNGDGTLSCTQRFELDGKAVDVAEFDNIYHAEGQISPAAHKILKGQELTEGMFEFEMTDSDGNVISTGRNDAAGVVSFAAIAFDESDAGNTYYYTMKEKAGNDSTVIYTEEEYLYEVSVRDMRNGKLSFTTHVYETKAQYDERKAADETTNDASEAAGEEDVEVADENGEGEEAGNVEVIEINGGQYVAADPVFTNDSIPGTLVLEKKVDGVAGQDYDPNAEFTFHVTLDSPGNYEFNREKQKDAWAVYTPDDQTMRFVRAADEAGALARVGEVRGAAVDEDAQAWTGFENFEAERQPDGSFDWYTTIVPWGSLKAEQIDFVDTVSPQAINGWFARWDELVTVNNIENLDMSQCESINQFFEGCTALTVLDASHMDVSKCKSFSYVFSYTGIKELDLSSWDIRNAELVQYVATGSDLDKLVLGEYFVTDHLHNINLNSSPFGDIGGMQSVSTGEFYKFFDPTPSMLDGKCPIARGVADTYVPKTDVYAIYTPDDKTMRFVRAKSEYAARQRAMNVRGIVLPTDTQIWSGFEKVEPKYNQYGALDNVQEYNIWDRSVRSTVEVVDFVDEVKPRDINNWFSEASQLTTVKNIENLDTSNCEYIAMFFNSCPKLTEFDATHMDVSNCIYFSHVFSDSAIKKLDLSSWDTRKAQTMSWISNWNGYITELTLGELFQVNCQVSMHSSPFGEYGKNKFQSVTTGMKYAPMGEDQFDDNGHYMGNAYGLPNGVADTYVIPSKGYAILTENNTLTITHEHLEGIQLGDYYDDSLVTYIYSYIDQYAGLETFLTNRTHESSSPWSGVASTCRKVLIKDDMSVSNAQYWFYNFEALEIVEGFEKVSLDDGSAQYIFYGCDNLRAVNLSGFQDTTKNYSGSGYMFLTRKVNQYVDISSLCEVTLGNNTIYPFGSSAYTSYLPAGVWVAQSDGTEYTEKTIPSCKADTYVRKTSAYAVHATNDNTNSLVFIRAISSNEAKQKVASLTGLSIIDGPFKVNENEKLVYNNDGSISCPRPEWLDSWNSTVTSVVFLDSIKPNGISNWFDNFTNLQKVEGLDNLDLSSCEVIDGFIKSPTSLSVPLQDLDFSCMDVSNVKYFNKVLEGIGLETVDISDWNIADDAVVDSMFVNGWNLKKIVLPLCNRNIDIYKMFYNCTNIDTVVLPDNHRYNNLSNPGYNHTWGINLPDGVHTYASYEIPQGQGGTYWKWSWGGNNDITDDDTGFSPLSLIGNMFDSLVNPPAVNAAENNIEPIYDIYGEPIGTLWTNSNKTNIVTKAQYASENKIDLSEDGQQVYCRFDANGGYFPQSGNHIFEANGTVATGTVRKVAHSDNLDDEGNGPNGYKNNIWNVSEVSIPGAQTLSVTITVQTESTSYDWVSLYDKNTEPTAYNYNDSISGKIGGSSKTTKTYTIEGDTVRIAFRTDGSGNTYYGYYAVVEGTGPICNFDANIESPVHYDATNNVFAGWSETPHGEIVDLSTITTSTTLYAQWKIPPVYAATYDNDTLVIGTGTVPNTFNGKQLTEEFEAANICDVTNTDVNIPWRNVLGIVSDVYIVNKLTPKSTVRWFDEGYTIKAYHGLENIDMSQCTNMSNMFSRNVSLVEADFSAWDTSNVTTISNIFTECSSLENFKGVEQWDTSNVTDMSSAFSYCAELKQLDLSMWDTSNVEGQWSTSVIGGFSGMFSGDYNLIEIKGLENWNVSKAMTFESMFNECSSLKNIDGIRNWDVSNADNFYRMFAGSGLTSINLEWSPKIANMYNYMFQDCHSLKQANIILHLSAGRYSSNFSNMFENCEQLEYIAMDKWTISGIMSDGCNINISEMFKNCQSLETVDFTWSDYGDEYGMKPRVVDETYSFYEGAFNGCQSLRWIAFPSNAGGIIQKNLPVPNGNLYTGKWISYNAIDSQAYDTDTWVKTVMSDADNGYVNVAGTWEWETKATTLNFNANGGTGSSDTMEYRPGQPITLPSSSFYKFGHTLASWNTSPDGTGTSYPAGTAIDNMDIPTDVPADILTLYAIWQPENTSIDASRGEFDVTLHPNETLTIPDVPAGTTYTVTEKTPSGWSQVASGTVGTDGKILPAATSTATIQNEYSTGKTVANIMAKKFIDSIVPTSNQLISSDGTPYFTFDLFESDAQGNAVSAHPVSTASANAASAIVFDPIEYNSVSDIANGDDHYYVIKERSNPATDSYYGYAENLVVKVHVSDDGKGYLSNEIEYIGGSNVMNNVSKPARLIIEKNTAGNVDALPDSTFTFEVTLTSPQGNVDVRRVEIQGKERATIEDIPLGTTYSVREIDIPSGWKNTNDTDAITGSFAVGKDIEQSATFTNTYTASPVSVMFEASKHMADGSSIQEDQFEFCLYDSTDTPDATKPAGTATPMQTKTNAEDGTITFDMMTFTRPGTYVYLMTEKAGSNPDISYDTHVEKIVVNVTDDGSGHLVATTSYDADGDGVLSFENSYRSGMLEITKTAINATSQALDNMEYSFTIHMSDAQGNALNDMPYKKMQAGENGTWTEIESERVSDGDVVTMRTDQKIAVEIPARSKWEVAENVPDGFQAENDTIRGTIEHAGTDNPSTAHFVNRYFATGALQFSANKIAEGFTLAESQFSFVLNGGEYVAGSYRDDIDMPVVEDDDEDGNDSDNEGAVGGTDKNVTPSTYASSTQTYESRNTEDGKIVFPALTYTQSDDGKQFVYTIVESNDGAKNIAYDSRQYKLIVNVTDNGNGTVRADAYLSDAAKMKLDSDGRIDVSNMTPLDESDEMQFVNVYATALPFTGGAGLPAIIVIIGLVLTIGGMGIIYITNRRRPSNKNNRQGNEKQ